MNGSRGGDELARTGGLCTILMPLGDNMVGMAGNFTLPDEVLAALPKDPSEQLYLAWHIKAMVVVGWVSELEQQPAHQRAEAMDKDHENGNLGERVMLLDVMPQETNASRTLRAFITCSSPRTCSQLKAPPGPEHRAHGGRAASSSDSGSTLAAGDVAHHRSDNLPRVHLLPCCARPHHHHM
jgi:hypothetical protein